MGKERPPRRTRAISTRSLTRWLANSRHSLPSMVSLPPTPLGHLRGRVPATFVPDMMSLKRLTSRAMRGIRRRPRLTTSRRKWAGPARRARPSGGWAPLRLGPGRWSYGVIRWGQPGVSVARAKRLPGPLAARATSGPATLAGWVDSLAASPLRHAPIDDHLTVWHVGETTGQQLTLRGSASRHDQQHWSHYSPRDS